MKWLLAPAAFIVVAAAWWFARGLVPDDATPEFLHLMALTAGATTMGATMATWLSFD